MLSIFSKIIDSWSKSETLTGRFTASGDIFAEDIDELCQLLTHLWHKELIKSSSTVSIIDEPDDSYTIPHLNEFKCEINNKGRANVTLLLDKVDTSNKLIIFSFTDIKEIILKSIGKETVSRTIDNFYRRETWLLQWSLDKPITYVDVNRDIPDIYKNARININDKSSSILRVCPYNINIDEIPDEGKCIEFKVLSSSLINYISLLIISSSVTFREGKIHILFDGHREKDFAITPENVIESFSGLNKYVDMYFWIYKLEDKKSQNFQERIEIIRNLISITYDGNEDIISNNMNSCKVLSKAKSSYRLYLKSKTKEYFDMRFKLEDHLDKIYSSLGTEYERFSSLFRNNLYAFFGLLTTTVIFSIIRGYSGIASVDNPVDKLLLDENLSLIISIYGIFSLIFLFFSSSNYFSNVRGLINKKSHFKSGYKKFMDEEDIDDILGGEFDNKVEINKMWARMIILIWIIISISLLFNKALFQIYYSDGTASGSLLQFIGVIFCLIITTYFFRWTLKISKIK